MQCVLSIYHSLQVLKTASSVQIELVKVSLCWSANTKTNDTKWYLTKISFTAAYNQHSQFMIGKRSLCKRTRSKLTLVTITRVMSFKIVLLVPHPSILSSPKAGTQLKKMVYLSLSSQGKWRHV